MRIALVIPHLGGGGAERSTLKLARGLLSRGHKVDLLDLGDTDTLAHEIPTGIRRIKLLYESTDIVRDSLNVARCCGFRIVPLLRRKTLSDARAISIYINEERPDCILPSLSRAKTATLLAVCFAKFHPVIIPIIRNALMNRTRRSRKLYSILLPRADHIVTVSDGVAENVVRSLKIPRERISRVYNPVVTAEVAEMALAIPDHPWLADGGPPVVLSVGRLARVKDFPTLLRAIRQVSINRPVRLIILGEGSWRIRLEKMVRKLGIETFVSLPGWVDNPYAFMSRSSALVLSSRHEGLGNVLIEAMACGCPCVSTNCPFGPAEILDGGRFGPLVPVGNASALAVAVESVLDCPPNRSTLLERAENFSFTSSIDHYEHILFERVGYS